MSTLFLGSGTIQQLAVLIKTFQTSLHQGEVTSGWFFPMFIVYIHHFLCPGLASRQKSRVWYQTNLCDSTGSSVSTALHSIFFASLVMCTSGEGMLHVWRKVKDYWLHFEVGDIKDLQVIKLYVKEVVWVITKLLQTKKLPQCHSPTTPPPPKKISRDDDDYVDYYYYYYCGGGDNDVFLFLLTWNMTMATDRTGKSVQHYRNNSNKMPTILTRAQEREQGSWTHFQYTL
jgi:hypothetical protein